MNKHFVSFFLTVLLLFFLFPAFSQRPPSKWKFLTTVQNCPESLSADLVIKITEKLEKEENFWALQRYLDSLNYKEHYFISDYKIQKRPLKKESQIFLKCANPVFKIDYVKDNSFEKYSGILADNGKIYSDTMAIVFEQFQKQKKLPYLSLSFGHLESPIKKDILELYSLYQNFFSQYLNEVILNEEKELIFILFHPFKKKIITAFLGQEEWDLKVKMLKRMVLHFSQEKTIPSSLNLSNTKKIVARFED